MRETGPWTLPGAPASAGHARRLVRRVLSSGGWDVDVDVAVLLVSEVVTNAVLHARTEVVLEIRPADDHLWVGVSDGSPVRPRVNSYSLEAGTGRGMRLLGALAADWGVDHGPIDGKRIWFEIGREPAGQGATFDQTWLQVAE